MKLSLSVRIAESSSRKDRSEMPLEELAPLARAAGFEGLSMRASAISVAAPPARVQQVRNLVRVMLQTPDDIAPARHAADIAAERGLALAQQTHWGTLCETIDQALDLVRAIDRPNFGITFEPANLMACGGGYGPDAVARIAPHLANVYFQNVRRDPAGTHRFSTRARGEVPIAYVPLDDPSGIDAVPLIDALDRAGYDGWFTVHQPLRPGQTVRSAIDEAARVFRPLIHKR